MKNGKTKAKSGLFASYTHNLFEFLRNL